MDVGTTATKGVLYDEKGKQIESAYQPMSKIKIPFDREVKVGSMLRMKV